MRDDALDAALYVRIRLLLVAHIEFAQSEQIAEDRDREKLAKINAKLARGVKLQNQLTLGGDPKLELCLRNRK